MQSSQIETLSGDEVFKLEARLRPPHERGYRSCSGLRRRLCAPSPLIASTWGPRSAFSPCSTLGALTCSITPTCIVWSPAVVSLQMAANGFPAGMGFSYPCGRSQGCFVVCPWKNWSTPLMPVKWSFSPRSNHSRTKQSGPRKKAGGVERSFAWLGETADSSKDYEYRMQTWRDDDRPCRNPPYAKPDRPCMRLFKHPLRLCSISSYMADCGW